ncbi:hypothetical protein J6358_15010 [Burkholderia pseudomallei]|uniref:hypothetical protein n=1 Tax=Burkholderia pseudomallei TaxID=28450 RepID=UPI001AD6CA02|nr:hypothetical protein [Burkholderia pseudomallei]MBO7752791.1 hypothetical protein [Burkholderia pseudomallei]MBO7804360.1 hypothetical protein [Burkholderia pseudomallei]MBO7931048.1 hypothetical protein [Burkholderia pseudomallei]
MTALPFLVDADANWRRVSLSAVFINQMIALQPTPYWSVTVENGISRPILVSLESTKLREQP